MIFMRRLKLKKTTSPIRFFASGKWPKYESPLHSWDKGQKAFFAWQILREFFFQPGVNFINISSRAFFVQTSFWQPFLVTFRLCQKFRMKNARVKRWWNRHQESISSTFYVQIFSMKVLCEDVLLLCFHFLICLVLRACVKFWWN